MEVFNEKARWNANKAYYGSRDTKIDTKRNTIIISYFYGKNCANYLKHVINSASICCKDRVIDNGPIRSRCHTTIKAKVYSY